MRAAVIAVDIGNTTIRCGLFTESWRRDAIPTVERVLCLEASQDWEDELQRWCGDHSADWYVGSVNQDHIDKLLRCLHDRQLSQATHELRPHQFPIQNGTDFPERVGVDRIAASTAAHALSSELESAIVVDAGTAIKVDLVDATGRFCGGNIFPGFRLMTQALARDTDRLPSISWNEDVNVLPLGTNTESAIRNGILASAVGGVSTLVASMQSAMSGPMRYFLTGGDAVRLQPSLSENFHLEPDLVLIGLALAAREVTDDTA